MLKKFSLLILIICLFIFSSCNKTVKIGTKTLDASKTYTIYIAQSDETAKCDDMRKGMVIGLKDLGLVEDINLKYIYENAKGNQSYAKQIANSILEKNPDLIVSIGEKCSKEVFEICKDIPSVFLGCASASAMGLCDKTWMPIGNMTGVRDSHLIDERLSNINNNYPDIKKIGIIYTADNITSSNDVDYYKFYATAYDIDIHTVKIKKASDLDKAMDSIIPKVDAIVVVSDEVVDTGLDKIVDRAKSENKLVFGREKSQEKLGLIVEEDADYQLVGKKGAEFVNDVLVNEKDIKEIKVEEISFR